MERKFVETLTHDVEFVKICTLRHIFALITADLKWADWCPVL